MIFEHGDDDLIEALIREGVKFDEIADKWGATTKQLKTFCTRKGITIPASEKRPDKNGCRKYRLLAEKGEHLSPTVCEIISLSKSMAADAIAAKVKRSKDYVVRMIELHVKKDAKARHRARAEKVKALVDSHKISAPEACAMLGITIGKYQYSCRQIGWHR